MINLIINLVIILAVLLLQSIFPVLYIKSLTVSPDLLLLLLTFYALRSNNRFFSVLAGFFIGLIQDFLSQIELIGIFAFIKSISGFSLGSLNNYNGFFSRKIIIVLIFAIYCIHFLLFYLIRFNSVSFNIILFIKIVLLNSLINIILFILLDRILFNSKSIIE